MRKDYKPRQSNKKGSPLLTGLLIGFLLGVVTAAALTAYLKGDTSPFQDSRTDGKIITGQTAQTTKQDKLDKKSEPANDFDFYTDLPKIKNKAIEKEIKNTPTVVKESYHFLQIGAFQNAKDADNMKAKLALQGFEATIQTANMPDKGTWHRVRIGPLNSAEEINKMRSALLSNNFKADLVKVQK